MASLVLGAVGAAIGYAMGPLTFLGMTSTSLGWSIGSTIGSLIGGGGGSITQYGPRLGDLKVQASTHGAPIPKVYGAMRLAGNMIWSKPILETKHKKSSGGKGGGGQKVTTVTYTYSQTFAIGICEGPIVGVRKIWANGELIYNLADDAEITTIMASNKQASGITFYLGTDTQVANSLIEADVGAANCPAYRGLCYVVFNNLQLAKYGNRTPNLEFEVIADGTDAWITYVTDPNAFTSVVAHSCTYQNGLIYRGERSGAAFQEKIYDLDGNLLSTINFPLSIADDPICINWHGLLMDQSYPYRWINAIEEVETPINALPWWPGAPNGRVIRLNSYLMRVELSGLALIMLRFPIAENEYTPASDHDIYATIYTYPAGHTYTLGVVPDTTNNVFYHFAHTSSVGAADARLVQFDPDGNVLDYWNFSGLTFGAIENAYKVENGVFYCFSGTRMAVRLDAAHGTTVLGSYPSMTGPTGSVAFDTPGISWWSRSIFTLGHQTGTAGIALGDIVDDICTEAGAGTIDVTDLSETVHGYMRTQRGPARGQIEPLMAAFSFDAVEVDGTIAFVSRGGAVAAAIPEDDLAAHAWGSEQPDTALLERVQDVELPDEVLVTFLDADAAYLVSAQYGRRLIGSSRSKHNVSMPIALSADQAKHAADVIMFDAWQGRVGFSFQAGPEYNHLVPTDVVTLTKGGTTYTVRIASRGEQGGVLFFEGFLEDLQIYDQNAPAPSMTGQPSTVVDVVPTRLELLDIPLLKDIDDGVGFYTAAGGYLADWRGCQIYKSTDDGATWDAFGDALLEESALGNATTALGSFGQNIFDETNTVTVTLICGTLSSTTELAVLNGSNAALLGDEIIQYKNATLVSGTTYTLSGLLRGRRGTEWAITTHRVSDRFVELSAATTYLQPAASAEIGLPRRYRGVSFDDYLDNAIEQTMTFEDIAAKPYAPVLLGGGRDAALNLTIKWVRRGRIGGEWRDVVDVPVGEDSEAYEVEIWTSGYATLKRTITGLTSASASYTAAEQTTDFGATQSTVYCRVYQLSALVGRGTKLQGTV